MQTLGPDEVIILFGERRTGDLPVMPPDAPFCADDILAEYVHSAIQLDRLWEVVATSCNLADCFGVGDVGCDAARRNSKNDIGARVIEYCALAAKLPFGI